MQVQVFILGQFRMNVLSLSLQFCVVSVIFLSTAMTILESGAINHLDLKKQ